MVSIMRQPVGGGSGAVLGASGRKGGDKVKGATHNQGLGGRGVRRVGRSMTLLAGVVGEVYAFEESDKFDNYGLLGDC